MAPTEAERLAVVERDVKVNETREGECRVANHTEHGQMFDRIARLEIEMARMAVRIGVWAAIGSLFGSGMVGLLFLAVQKKLIP